jgi:hypothetical protein
MPTQAPVLTYCTNGVRADTKTACDVRAVGAIIRITRIYNTIIQTRTHTARCTSRWWEYEHKRIQVVHDATHLRQVLHVDRARRAADHRRHDCVGLCETTSPRFAHRTHHITQHTRIVSNIERVQLPRRRDDDARVDVGTCAHIVEIACNASSNQRSPPNLNNKFPVCPASTYKQRHDQKTQCIARTLAAN